MRDIVNTYLPDDKKYEEFFDIFEYLTGLIYLDIINEGKSINCIVSTIGRFAWKGGTPFNRGGLPKSIKVGLEEVNYAMIVLGMILIAILTLLKVGKLARQIV